MSTNPEILPRALRWSRAVHSASALSVVAATLAVAFALLLPSPAVAQSDSSVDAQPTDLPARLPDGARYLLVVGPQTRSGLDFLSPNAIEYTYGRYRTSNGSIEVYHVDNAPPPATSGRLLCPTAVIGLAPAEIGVPGEAGAAYARYDGRDFTLFMRWSAELVADDLCPFLTAFLSDFAFYRTVSDPLSVPFPALIK